MTGLNRNQRNTRENRRIHEVHWEKDKEKVRHAQEKSGEDRHGRKVDFDVETRRANNEYLIHDHRGRKTRSNRPNRPKDAAEDFRDGVEDFSRNQRRFWGPKNDGPVDGTPEPGQAHDYFGDYDAPVGPTKRSLKVEPPFDLADLLRPKRYSGRNGENDDYKHERRDKREDDDPRCTSDVTTLTVGCSTADRMEFQGDCPDDDAVTGQLTTL